MYRFLFVVLTLTTGCGTLPVSDGQTDPNAQSIIPSEIDVSMPVDDSSTNENQDQDGDGLTLSTEQVFGASDSSTDSDLDGLSDFEEVTIFFTDPTTPDSDFDGLSDFDELMIFGTDPWLTDSDLDGLGDGEEQRLGTDPTLGDTDGDGLTDQNEVNSNTNPLDPFDPPVFVAGDLFSFLTQEETDVLRRLDTAARLLAARENAACAAQIEQDRASRGVSSGSSDRHLCVCLRPALELVVQGFEDALLNVLAQVGYDMTRADLTEVSAYMHNRFDTDDGCVYLNCTLISSICAW